MDHEGSERLTEAVELACPDWRRIVLADLRRRTAEALGAYREKLHGDLEFLAILRRMHTERILMEFRADLEWAEAIEAIQADGEGD